MCDPVDNVSNKLSYATKDTPAGNEDITDAFGRYVT